MAKVKYYAKENTKVGPHRFYVVPVLPSQAAFADSEWHIDLRR